MLDHRVKGYQFNLRETFSYTFKYTFSFLAGSQCKMGHWTTLFLCLLESDVPVQCMQTAHGGPEVERSPSVWEVVGSIPGRMTPKTLKWYLMLPYLGLDIQRIDQAQMVGFPIVYYKM